MAQTNFIESWLGENQARVDEITQQNPQLSNAILNVLEYVNNYYGGSKIDTKTILSKPTVVATPPPTVAPAVNNLADTKIIFWNREDRDSFINKMKELDIKEISNNKNQTFYLINEEKNNLIPTKVFYGVEQDKFILSPKKEIFLQDLGLLRPFVNVAWADDISTYAISTKNFEESKELIDMVRRLKNKTPSRKETTVAFDVSPNILARHNYFTFMLATSEDKMFNINRFKPLSSDVYSKSNKEKMTFDQFKKIFVKNEEEQNKKVTTPTNIDLVGSKIVILDKKQSQAVQQIAFEQGYKWNSLNAFEFKIIPQSDFPVVFYFPPSKELLFDYNQGALARYNTDPSKPLSLYDLGITTLGNNVVATTTTTKTPTKTIKPTKKSITLQHKATTTVQASSNEEDFDDLLDELNNLEL